jgi:hypothetical protein
MVWMPPQKAFEHLGREPSPARLHANYESSCGGLFGISDKESEGLAMPAKSINHLAVWLSAIVFYVWSYLWYSIFFKNATIAAMTAMNSQPVAGPVPYIVGALMALVIGYGTAIALADSEHHTASHGLSFGIFMGIIFYAAPTLTQNQFGGHPITWWLLDAGWAVSGFAIVGAIVGGWKARAVPATT